MIPKLSSQELNDIMLKAQGAINDFNSKVKTMKADAEKKLEIINFESEYTQAIMTDILEGKFKPEAYMPRFTNRCDGNYELYGNTVHAKFIKEPINIFNLNISGIGESYFRDDVKVLINDTERDEYLALLMHDSILKTRSEERRVGKEC